MKIRIKTIAVLLIVIAVLLCSFVGCAADGASTTGNADTTGQTSDAQGAGLLVSSSPMTTTVVSGGMYLHIVGKVQGEIHGECRESGDKKDTVALVDFADGVNVPIDADSGLPMGRRQYETVTFVHKLDNTSPRLRKALSNGETLDLTVDFYRIKSDGTEEKYYSIHYENALIVSMEIFTSERNTHLEEVSFTFGNVTYAFNDGNVSFGDSWN